MVVLAAGAATRFGATKQLVEVDGRPLVVHAAAAALAADVGEVVIVVGHDHRAVAAAARSTGAVTVVRNPDHAAGQATSLQAGLRAAANGDAEVAVVVLADEPDVTAYAIRTVAAAVTGEVVAARARYDDGDGHPVAFARAVWSRLAGLEGDRGARDVLAGLGVVPVRVAGPRPHDVDTPDDLAALGSARPSSRTRNAPP